MTNIMLVYGTRPEAIKVAPIAKELQGDGRFSTVVAVTGQHREMLDQVNELFGIVPDHDLDVFHHGQSLNSLFSRILTGMDHVLREECPKVVIVQGDTTTAVASAVAAFHRQIPVVHVEAGLRSFDIRSPFPEEANRRLISQVASLHLPPTQLSGSNLLREGIPAEAVYVTGNTVIDALLDAVQADVPITDSRLAEAVASDRRFVLVTTHRRENQGEAMRGVGRALSRLARLHPDVLFVLPAHRNPVVRDAVLPAVRELSNVLISEPLAYGEFTHLLSRAHVVLTDSGGLQEEAPSLGKPVLVMRENTERPEALEAGTVRLIGTEEQTLVDEVHRLLTDVAAYEVMATAVNPYGDGHAAARVVSAIAELVGVGDRLPPFESQ